MVTATAPPPNRGFVGGWLSMAPETESVASPSRSSSGHLTKVTSDVESTCTDSPRRRSPSSPHRTTTGPSFNIPKRATFQLGTADDTSNAPTPITPASKQSSASMLSPVFDVRASFAPMTFAKRPSVQLTVDPSLDSGMTADSTSEDSRNLLPAQGQRNSALSHIVDDGAGLEFAGRRWKGKTAHAVEQELEQVGDTTIMSYAPDAVYLASRLEGLRRNLEAGGDEARGRRWLVLEEDEEEVAAAEGHDVEKPTLPLATTDERIFVPSPKPHSPAVLLPQDRQFANASNEPSIETPSQQSTIREDRLPASLPPHITDIFRPPTPLVVQETPANPSPAAKAAALDSRVEIRLLRRSDLEQVRELHCLYGDEDKVDEEHYATSAAFLLRLLVDESHVCLVAVAKPLPAPEQSFDRRHHYQHHKHHLPTPPPPSMDMPASSMAYVLAGQGISSNSPLLRPIDALTPKGGKQRAHRPPPSSLGRHSPVLGVMNEEDEGSESDADSMKADRDGEDDRFGDDSTSISGSSPPAFPLDSSSPAPSSSTSPPSTKAATTAEKIFLPQRSIAARGSGDDQSDGVPHSLSASYTSSSNSLGSGAAPKRTYETTVATTTKASRIRSSIGEEEAVYLPQMPLPPGHNMILTGPTNEVAPPRALRVMIPPAPGAPVETELILGVASASISIKPATESLWGPSDTSSSRAVKEVHILTLSVAPAEREMGLGGRLLDRLMDEALRRNISSAYRASMGRRIVGASSDPSRVYLEVHPDSKQAIALYKGRGFVATRTLKGYFRGDARIPTNVRSLPGGSDGILMEKWDKGEQVSA